MQSVIQGVLGALSWGFTSRAKGKGARTKKCRDCAAGKLFSLFLLFKGGCAYPFHFGTLT